MGKIETSPFKGADIKLGSVTLTGKAVSDFSLSEVSYIIARYMFQHAKGGEYHGSVGLAISRLWPDDRKNFTSMVKNKIYSVLRMNGFKYQFNGGEELGFWKVPTEIGDHLFINGSEYDKIYVRDVPESPIVYRCGICREVMKDRETLVLHLQKEKEKTVSQVMVERRMHLCQTCNKLFDQGVYAAHLTQHEVRPCKICGETMRTPKLGSHMRLHNSNPLHQLPSGCIKLLDLITQTDGSHPREYAATMGINNFQVSHLGMVLKKKGFIYTTGKRSSTRYFLNSAKGTGAKAGDGRAADAYPFPNSSEKELLEVVTQIEGEHPRDYALLLGLSNSAVSARAKRLKKAGLLRSTGVNASTRYFLPKDLNGAPSEPKDAEKKSAFLPAKKTYASKIVGASVIFGGNKLMVVLDDGEILEVLDYRIHQES